MTLVLRPVRRLRCRTAHSGILAGTPPTDRLRAGAGTSPRRTGGDGESFGSGIRGPIPPVFRLFTDPLPDRRPHRTCAPPASRQQLEHQGDRSKMRLSGPAAVLADVPPADGRVPFRLSQPETGWETQYTSRMSMMLSCGSSCPRCRFSCGVASTSSVFP